LTGKTRSLLEYLEQELKLVAPNRVAFMTFTRAARLEALQRTGRLEADLPFVRTIHALCYRELGMSQEQIVKRENLMVFGKLIGEKVTGNQVDPWLAEELGMTWEPPTLNDELLRINHLGRHRLIHLKQALDGTTYDWLFAKWFTESYREWKGHENLLDYTDLLSLYLSHGKPLPVDVAFIDEAQDLSPLQWKVVHLLTADAQRVYLAGDDDQAIFSWAGASADHFIDEPSDLNRVLGQSYRVPRTVHQVASTVVSRLSRRLTKDYRPKEEPGTAGYLGFLSEDSLSMPSYILFRNHHRGSKLMHLLEHLSIPFKGPGTLLSDPKVHLSLVAWDKLIRGESLDYHEVKSLLRVSTENVFKIRRPQDRIKPADLLQAEVKLEDWPRVLTKLPRLDYLERACQLHGWAKLLNPDHELMSIHQAKGREQQQVVVDTEMAQRTWESFNTSPDDEHRVMYVAVTRTITSLLILLSEDPRHYEFE
jgi:superfamily I DNA/RNA helicase